MVPKLVARGRAPTIARAYRLLDNQWVALTKEQIEEMVGGGLLSPDTKVFQEGENFATALRCRAEFQHLSVDDSPGGRRRARR